MKEKFIIGAIGGLIFGVGVLIYRFIYLALFNSDFSLKHFNYSNSTDLYKIEKCLEYWVRVKNYEKIELVASRLIDFDYKNKIANEEIVKAIYFNRKYTRKDEMYFETILNDFDKLSLDQKSSFALFLFLKGICAEHNGNITFSTELKEKALKYNSNLKSEHLQYFN